MEVDFFLIITKVALLTATIASLARWKRFISSAFRLFPFYLLVVVGIEIVVHLSSISSLDKQMYSLFDIVTYLFFTFWFYKILKEDKKVLALGILYVLSLVISLTLEDLNKELQIQSSVGTIMMFVLSIMYYINLLKSDNVVAFSKLPSFWIVTGILIFNLAYLPITFSLSADFLPSGNVVYLILVIVNVVLYGFYTIAFLCPQKE
jgi:hypothetical protein